MLNKVAGTGAMLSLGTGFVGFAVPAIQTGPHWNAYWQWATGCLVLSALLFIVWAATRQAEEGDGHQSAHHNRIWGVLTQFGKVTVRGNMLIGAYETAAETAPILAPSNPILTRPEEIVDETENIRFVRHGRLSPRDAPEWDRIVWECSEHPDVMFTYRSGNANGELRAIRDPHASYVTFGTELMLILHCAGDGVDPPHDVYWSGDGGNDFWTLFTEAEARLLAKRRRVIRATTGEQDEPEG